jgi:hypothetical protein
MLCTRACPEKGAVRIMGRACYGLRGHLRQQITDAASARVCVMQGMRLGDGDARVGRVANAK